MKTSPERESAVGTSPAAVAAIDSVASEWVMRRDAGLDPRARHQLTEWLAADVRHRDAFTRLAGAWAVFDRAGQTGATPAMLAQLKIRARKRRTLRHTATAGGLLATLALLVTFLVRPAARISPSISAPPAQLAGESIRKLPDGSIVELNEHADIAVQFEPEVRRVHLLRGEALFRVEQDPARPFLVQAGSVEVRAVGTAFNVRLEDKAVEVLVTHGKVRVEDTVHRVSLLPETTPADDAAPSHSEPERVLVAGQRVVVSMPATAARPEVHVASMGPDEIDQRLAWRIPQLEFGGMDLAQAVTLMNRQNRLQISVGDAATGKMRISGVFRTDNPEGFVRIVGETFGLRAERVGEHEIVLRRAP